MLSTRKKIFLISFHLFCNNILKLSLFIFCPSDDKSCQHECFNSSGGGKYQSCFKKAKTCAQIRNPLSSYFFKLNSAAEWTQFRQKRKSFHWNEGFLFETRLNNIECFLLLFPWPAYVYVLCAKCKSLLSKRPLLWFIVKSPLNQTYTFQARARKLKNDWAVCDWNLT